MASLLLALVATQTLLYFLSLQVETPKVDIQWAITNETVYTQPIVFYTNGPSYFESVGKLYAYVTSPYATAFVTFEVWLSTDNSSWTEIPLFSNQTSDHTRMANLGLISFDNPKVVLYEKYYIPPQEFAYTIFASKEQIENSFKGYIEIVKEPTAKDTATLIFAFFVIFALILQVTDFLIIKQDRKEKKGKGVKTIRTTSQIM